VDGATGLPVKDTLVEIDLIGGVATASCGVA
jgi:hypothetical protein